MVAVPVRNVDFGEALRGDGGFDPGYEIVGLSNCYGSVDKDCFFGTMD